MYDELVKRLREATRFSESRGYSGMANTTEEAADAIEELSKPRWIPVTERLPEDLQNVLVIDDGRVTIGHCEHFYGDEGKRYIYYNCFVETVAEIG